MNSRIETMTPSDAWGMFVGSQDPETFVDCCQLDSVGDDEIRGAVEDYVNGSPLCDDLTHQEADRVERLLFSAIVHMVDRYELTCTAPDGSTWDAPESMGYYYRMVFLTREQAEDACRHSQEMAAGLASTDDRFGSLVYTVERYR